MAEAPVCFTESFPIIFETDDGNFVFQGFVLSATQKTMLNMVENEDAVIIPKDFTRCT